MIESISLQYQIKNCFRIIPRDNEFIKTAYEKYQSYLEQIKKNHKQLNHLITSIQSSDISTHSQGQLLLNSFREYIFEVLQFCSNSDSYIPEPTSKFLNCFLYSDATEFLNLTSEIIHRINMKIQKLTKICLKLTSTYQGISPQPLPNSGNLLNLAQYPNLCQIEEDYYGIKNKIKIIFEMINQLFEEYLKLSSRVAIYTDSFSDPIEKLLQTSIQMRKKLDECEELFAKKTTYFKQIYDSLSESEKLSFIQELHSIDGDPTKEEETNNENFEEEELFEEEDNDEINQSVLFFRFG